MNGIGVALVSLLICAGTDEHRAADNRPAVLMPGLGRHHHPVSTRKDEAQRFFDQGLTLLFAFNHDEAARSFRRAAEIDPDLAMAQWGIALALGPNYNLPAVDADQAQSAYAALERAQSLALRAPEHERAYVDALAKRYSTDPKADGKQLLADYKFAMGELVRRYPDDLDAATLYAESAMNLRPWKLWTAQGTPAEGTDEIVSVLEGVLRRNPDHPGANHYYIHAVEASRRPERALPCAERLGSLVPAAAHLVRMPHTQPSHPTPALPADPVTRNQSSRPQQPTDRSPPDRTPERIGEAQATAPGSRSKQFRNAKATRQTAGQNSDEFCYVERAIGSGGERATRPPLPPPF